MSGQSGRHSEDVSLCSFDVTGWLFSRPIDRENRVTDRIAKNVKPPAATRGMAPLLRVDTFGVRAIEKIVGPLLVGQRIRAFGADNVGLTPILKLFLVALPAPRAFNS